jgi:hypothetical protein
MAIIPSSTFKTWKDGDTVKAKEYMQELEILRTAINANGFDLETLKAAASGILKGIQNGDEFPPNPVKGDMFYRTDEGILYILDDEGQWDALSLKATTDAHAANKENPHGVSAAQLGVYTKEETDVKFNYVTEKGTNSNGDYIKWSNGVLECWKTYVHDSTSINAWVSTPIAGSTYYSFPGDWTYPVPFKAGTIVTVFASGDINGVQPETHAAYHKTELKCGFEMGAFGVDVRGRAAKRHLYARGVWK